MSDYNKDFVLEIVTELRSYISQGNFSDKLSLNNGQLGLLLYYSFYSEIFNDEETRNLAQILFRKIINQYRNPADLNRNFFNGAMSFPFVVKCLTKIGILEEDNEVKSILLRYLRFNPNLNTSPAIIGADKTCFGEAISLISVFKEEDSLLSYAIKESIISLIDGCERLLYEDVPPIYIRKDMSIQYLHSIYFFLKWANGIKIYPTKTNKLLRHIDEHINCLDIEEDIHILILHYLKDKTLRYCNTHIGTELSYLQNLAVLGIYSLVYEIDIFDKYIDKLYLANNEKRITNLKLNGINPEIALEISVGLMKKYMKI